MMATIGKFSSVSDLICRYWSDQSAALNRLSAGDQDWTTTDACEVQGVLAAGQRRRSADQVHDLRVACRRLQSTAESFALYLPEKMPRRIIKAVRPIRRACDQVRDLDVLIDWLNKIDDQRLLPSGLTVDLGRKRQAAVCRLLSTLKKSDHHQAANVVSHEIDRLNRLSECGKDPQPPADAACSAMLMTLAARMTAWQNWFSDDRSNDDRDTALHQLRIAGKDFRYALELYLPAAAAGTDDLREKFCAFQDLLGEIHDRIRFADLLQQKGITACVPPEIHRELISLIMLQKQKLLQQFNQVWPKMTTGWFIAAVTQTIKTAKGR